MSSDIDAPAHPDSGTRPGESTSNWKLALFVAASLALLTGLVFGRAVVERFAFLYYDDHEYVFNNPRVSPGLSWSGIAWAFHPATRVSSNWHPLTLLSHMLDCQIFGLESWGHHLTNVLWHSANVVLLFGFLRSMTNALWRSALVAALFAWHPLHVESVAWVAERKDLLCAFFWLLGSWFYVGYARRPSAGRYAPVAGCLLLGLLAKPMIVTFPFTLLLLDCWPLQRLGDGDHPDAGLWRNWRNWRQRVLEKAPLFVLVLLGCAVTLRAQESAALSWERLTLTERVTNAALSYDTYLLKTFWPARLTTMNLVDEDGLRAGQGLLAAIPLVLLSAAAVLLRRRFPAGFVGWFWYLGTLVPVIGLVQVGLQAYADRYTYVPLIGIFIVVAWGLGELVRFAPRLTGPVIAGVVVVLALLMARTYDQLGYWRDTIVLLRHTLEESAENVPARYGLASALRAEARYDEAIAECDAILQLRPAFFEAHYMRGRALRESGRYLEAAGAFREALRQAQGRMDVRRSIQLSIVAARVYACHPDPQLRNPALAIELAEFANKITHYADPEVLDTLAAAYASAGRFDEAEARARTALGQALETRQGDLAARIRDRLEHYRRREPYVSDPARVKF